MAVLCFRVDEATGLLELAASAGGAGHPGTLSELPGGVWTLYVTDPVGVRIECVSGSPDLRTLPLPVR